MGDAIRIITIQSKCWGTIQHCSITKPFGHGILGVRPFSILTNSPNPGGEGWLKATLDRLDSTVKIAAVKCSCPPHPQGMWSSLAPGWQENYLSVLETIVPDERLFSKGKLGHAGAI